MVSQSTDDSDAVLSGEVVTEEDSASPGADAAASSPGVPAAGDPASGGASPGLQRKRFSRLAARWLPLTLILLIQAVVSGRLAWSNTAFGDEANYLWQGWVEWQHWLHGRPMAPFTDSGAPQLYPPLGAAVSALGGLTLARLLSLAFMLVATVLLYAAARRLFGHTTALWAAALGAFNEPVLRLAFATYDPLACLLLMLALYLAVRSASARHGGELVAAAGLCLLLSALVAVSYAIYIPVVALVMLLAWADRRGWEKATVPAIWQFILMGGAGVLAVSQLGVWEDFVSTTVTRATGLGAGVSTVAGQAWGWGGPLACLAIVAAILAFSSLGWRNPRSWLTVVLAAAALVVPAYQAYLGSTYSLDKHMAPGAELAAIGVGYAISSISQASGVRASGVRMDSRRAGGVRAGVTAGVAAIVLAGLLVSGTLNADTQFRQWPNTTALVSALRQRPQTGPVLVGADSSLNPAIFRYSLPREQWEAPPASFGSSGGKAVARGISRGTYVQAVQQLRVLALERDAVGSVVGGSGVGGPVAASLRNGVLAAAKDTALGARLEASGHYSVAVVLPYTSAAPSNRAGVFVIWTRND
jgi:hypothetical protein